MDTPREILRKSIQDAFTNTLMKLQSQHITLSDMYVRVQEDDEPQFVIYDDTENVLLTVPLDGWMEWRMSEGSKAGMNTFAALLEETVNIPEIYGLFDGFDYDTPFSLLLVDENMDIVSEILTIDHENILLGDDFWEKMDKELDEFYEKLMSDVSRKTKR